MRKTTKTNASGMVTQGLSVQPTGSPADPWAKAGEAVAIVAKARTKRLIGSMAGS
jgi:hypothetical protein